MAERLAVRATDTPQLADRLRDFVRGTESDAVVVGSVGGDSGGWSLLDDEDGAALVATILAKRQLSKLARLWTAGVPVDWQVCWTGPHPAGSSCRPTRSSAAATGCPTTPPSHSPCRRHPPHRPDPPPSAATCARSGNPPRSPPPPPRSPDGADRRDGRGTRRRTRPPTRRSRHPLHPGPPRRRLRRHRREPVHRGHR
ncbi:hypothetical protein ACFQ3Z_43075 [Streptomyces nogalater]